MSAEDDRGRCRSCGTHPNDWLDSDGRALEEPRWVATPIECRGCRAVHAVGQLDQVRDHPYMHVILEPNPEWHPPISDAESDDDELSTDDVT